MWNITIHLENIKCLALHCQHLSIGGAYIFDFNREDG